MSQWTTVTASVWMKRPRKPDIGALGDSLSSSRKAIVLDSCWRSAYCSSPNVNTTLPAAMVTNCRPSTAYVMGAE